MFGKSDFLIVLGLIALILFSGCTASGANYLVYVTKDINQIGGDGNGLSWADIGTATPWEDANVDDGITLTNLIQVTTRSYTDLQNLPNLQDYDTNYFSDPEAYQADFNKMYVGVDDLNNQTVYQIIAGSNVSISPTNGIGAVTINSTAAGAGIDTNAATACDNDEFLDGNGDCVGIDLNHLRITDNTLDLSFNSEAIEHAFNGQTLETIRIDVNSNGTTVNLFIQKNGGGDLTLHFSDEFSTFTSDPPASITLTAGSDTSPTLNYIFIPKSTKALTKNTTGFPDAEHAAVATVLVQSASGMLTDGPYKVHVWVDHTSDDQNQGHISHINEWIREQHASYKSGIAQTLTITSHSGSSDAVDFKTASGIILQLHTHAYPAFNTDGDVNNNFFVVNDNSTTFLKSSDINALLTDSDGDSMSGKYFSLVFWGVVSEDQNDSKMFVNLPSGSYNKQQDAVDDVSGFDNFNIPSDFKGTGFLISRLTLRHQAAAGGTWTSIQEEDLRGQFPSTFAGGTASITTEFSDNAFKLFDETDSTKELVWQIEGISPSTTRTWSAPNRDLNFAFPVFDDLNSLGDVNSTRFCLNGTQECINDWADVNAVAGRDYWSKAEFDTDQNLATTASPTFANLTIDGNLVVDKNATILGRLHVIDAVGQVAVFGNSDFADHYITLRDNENLGVNLGLDSSAASFLFQAGGSRKIEFATNVNDVFGAGTPDVVIETDGKMGIDMNSSQRKLHVSDLIISSKTVDTAVGTNAIIGGLWMGGDDPDVTNWDAARMHARASAAWTAGSSPTQLEFYTTPSGSTTEAKVVTIMSDATMRVVRGDAAGTPSIHSTKNVAVFQNTATTGSSAEVSIISGVTTGVSTLNFGNNTDEDRAHIDWRNQQSDLQFQIGAVVALNMTTTLVDVAADLDVGDDLDVADDIIVGDDLILAGGWLRLWDTDSPGSCGGAFDGAVYYDNSLNEPCFCDGTNWKQFDGGGNC